MKVWTIQPKEIYEYTMDNGYFVVDISKSDFYSCLKNGYDWMVEKMNEKIPNPNHIKFPIWAWYRWDGKEKRPDLRYNLFSYTGDNKDYSLIELEIPDSEILLSDYDNWHCVLNNIYLDESNSEKEFDEIQEWLFSIDPIKRNKLIKDSWNKIFNVQIRKDPTNWRNNGLYVQSTFWILKKEYIKSVKFFKGRKRNG